MKVVAQNVSYLLCIYVPYEIFPFFEIKAKIIELAPRISGHPTAQAHSPMHVLASSMLSGAPIECPVDWSPLAN